MGGTESLVLTLFVFPLGIALFGLTAFIQPRPAAMAGACVAWGAGFVVAMWLSEERCAQFNRQPNASCTMGDNTVFAIAGLAVLVVGVALTVYAGVRLRASLASR